MCFTICKLFRLLTVDNVALHLNGTKVASAQTGIDFTNGQQRAIQYHLLVRDANGTDAVISNSSLIWFKRSYSLWDEEGSIEIESHIAYPILGNASSSSSGNEKAMSCDFSLTYFHCFRYLPMTQCPASWSARGRFAT